MPQPAPPIPYDDLPPVSGWLQSGFQRFLPRYLARHFSLLAIDRQGYQPQGPPDAGDSSAGAMLLYANHPGWFDPLVAHYLTNRLFPERQFYAPIDAVALTQYQVFAKLGFYGIDLQSTAGASRFLKTSQRILATPNAALWLTPEGRFCDPRDHQQSLQPGLAHLCWRAYRTDIAAGNPVRILPLAIEYAFWDQRLPVCLLRFGQPVARGGQAGDAWDKATWAAQLEQRLRETQRQLAAQVIRRDPAAFDSLLTGRQGTGGIYDWLRRLRCWVTGQRYQAAHSGSRAHAEAVNQSFQQETLPLGESEFRSGEGSGNARFFD